MRMILLLALFALLPALGADDWEEAVTPKAHYDKAAGLLAEEAMTLGPKVLLVWLVDESASMKDDQEEVAARVRDIAARVDPGKTRLRMAVVGFGKEAAEFQAPTDQPDKVTEGIAKVPADSSGQERCMAAILFALQRYAKLPERKLLVMLTDERGDDEDRVEEALEALKKAKARFSCLGREAPFCSLVAQEASDGSQGVITVSAGPETPELEILRKDTGFLSNIPSGFGNWAQARLCRETGGTYHAYRSGAMRKLETAYDRTLLEADYAPFLGSRAEYDKLAQKTPLLGACRRAVQACEKVPALRGPYSPGTLAAELKDELAASRTRLESLGAQLALLEKARKSGYEAPPRVQASAELLAAQIRRERYIAQVAVESLEAVLAGSLPAMKPGEKAYLDKLVQGAPAHSPAAEALREEAEKACLALAGRLPKTPWAEAGRAFAKAMLPGRLVLKVYTPQSTPRPQY